MPIISIIIPVYNRAKVILNTLDSIAAQTFKDWECLLVDDFSTDDSWEILTEYAEKDERFHVLKNECYKGACGARNTGIKHAKGDFFQFFDSDDEMYPDLLLDLYNQLSEDVDVVTCWTNVVDVNSKEILKTFENITEGNIHSQLMTEKTYVDTNCALIRRTVVESIGGWSEDCPSYQEWDFHLRLSKVARYKTHRRHLINYNVGGTDTISKSLPKYVAGRLYILNKNKAEFVGKHFASYLKKLLTVYYMIKISDNSVEKSKLLNMFTEKTDLLSRLIVKCMYVPYCVLNYGRK